MPRQHDADLCDRIRELEKRVEELESRPHTTVVPSAYPWWEVPNTVPYPSPYPWTIWYGTTTGMTTVKSVSTDSSTYTLGDITT